MNEEKVLSITLKAYSDSNIQFRLVEIKDNYGTILCLAKPNIDIAVMLTKLCVDVEITMSCRCTIGYANARFTEECGITIFEYTTALQCGVDVKTVSTMLGHSSAGFTLNVYTHSTSRMQQEAARTVGKVMPKMLER